MIRGRFTIYLTLLALSVIFMLGFFKQMFVMDVHPYNKDPAPREMFGDGPAPALSKREEDKSRIYKPNSRRLLNGQKKFFSKKSPFVRDSFFQFTDLNKIGLKNPNNYGIELFKYLLGKEYSKDGDFDWGTAVKYNPKQKLLLKDTVENILHPIAPEFRIGDALPDTVVRQIHIATSWRSGSTFLGDLLNHNMGTFYSFEPLHFESLSMSTERRLDLMNNIFKCNFHNKEVIGWMKHASKGENNFLFQHNFRSFKICENLLPGKVSCYMDKFQSPICSMSPIRVIKTVRFRVKLAEEFLKNDKDFPHFKMVVLVRDPRGTMHSRSHHSWCSGEECINSTVVCENLEKDAQSAYQLAKKYPGKVYLLRYEDICMNPYEEVKSLFEFLKLPRSKGLDNFIQKHMFGKESKKHPYSTFRKSDNIYMEWRKTVDMGYIEKIQKDCSIPMKTLGYHSFSSPFDRDNFTISVLSKASESIWPKNLS
ncbi:carbohydrate sulfotransferase 1 isoform X2 [Lepeophtheirus salmonis]|nr:carbohydrate sulfotransferase 1-like isoform X2 [Lepeophtheirus salmonis]